MPSTPTQVLLEWQSLECYPHERSTRWYLLGGICVLAFAAYGLFDHSWSTTLLALLIGGVYFLLRQKPPRTMTVQITGLGIRIAHKFFPWNMLRAFWIIEVTPFVPRGVEPPPPHIELHFAPIKFLQPELVVFLNTIDPAAVRELLLKFLPERAGMEERALDTLARMLKL